MAAARDHINIERRVSPWVVVEGLPAWAGSPVAAYRIWQEFDGLRWYQCHEWEERGGNRRRWADPWIPSIRAWQWKGEPTTDEPPED